MGRPGTVSAVAVKRGPALLHIGPQEDVPAYGGMINATRDETTKK
jgi:hypothetical protein